MLFLIELFYEECCKLKIPYCWFARDVTAAMLVVKNKSVSLRWELNSIFMQILRQKLYCIDHQHGRLVTWLQTKNTYTKHISLTVHSQTMLHHVNVVYLRNNFHLCDL